jgi:hypothetical protein
MTSTTDLKERVEAACRTFKGRAPAEESTLTLDGTGVNGLVQFLILKLLGLDYVRRLRRVNLISGSAYTYCTFVAIESGEVPDFTARLSTWDANNRSVWHEASLWKSLRRLPAVAKGRSAFFSNECLENMMRGTASDAVAEKRLGELPPNATIWLYSRTEKRFLALHSESEFKDFNLATLARCFAAIPRIYSPAELLGHMVVDPVFSPSYKGLRKQLRAESTNHLIGNILVERTTADTIWVKPHAFGGGKRMMVEDFARMILNVRNPRINAAFEAAYGSPS